MTALGTLIDSRPYHTRLAGACVEPDASVAVPVMSDAGCITVMLTPADVAHIAAVTGAGEEFNRCRIALELALAEGRSRGAVLGRYERLQRAAAARARVTGVEPDELHRIYERAQPIQRQVVTRMLAEAVDDE